MRPNRISTGFLLSVLIAAACASGGRSGPSGVTQADVDVRTAGSLFFGSGTSAPLNLDVTVTNRASVPMTVRSIRISSPGMMQFTVRPAQKMFATILEPGETKTFPLSTTAIASRSRLSPTEPLNLRADIDFETNGRRFKEIFNFPSVAM